MGVSKNKGIAKMDGENNGTPYCLMDDLEETPLFLETSTYTNLESNSKKKHEPMTKTGVRGKWCRYISYRRIPSLKLT